MAVRVSCSYPASLLRRVVDAIQDGSVATWELDSDGDLTHSPPQWKGKAWFHPVVQEDRLSFYILGQRSKRMSRTVYGVYHGRLIEMLLAHFDEYFSRVSATSVPVNGDKLGD